MSAVTVRWLPPMVSSTSQSFRCHDGDAPSGLRSGPRPCPVVSCCSCHRVLRPTDCRAMRHEPGDVHRMVHHPQITRAPPAHQPRNPRTSQPRTNRAPPVHYPRRSLMTAVSAAKTVALLVETAVLVTLRLGIPACTACTDHPGFSAALRTPRAILRRPQAALHRHHATPLTILVSAAGAGGDGFRPAGRRPLLLHQGQGYPAEPRHHRLGLRGAGRLLRQSVTRDRCLHRLLGQRALLD